MEHEIIQIKCKNNLTMKNGRNKGKFTFIKGRYYEAVKTFASVMLIGLEAYETKNELGMDTYLTDRTLKENFVIVGQQRGG